MKENLEQIIKEKLKELFDIDADIKLTIPPEKKFGDYSTNVAFTITKKLQKPPAEIASALAESLKSLPLIKDVQVVAPGFVNITIDPNKFFISLLQSGATEGLLTPLKNIGKGNNASVEHTAANPNKNLHIGHLRNFSIGDTIVRVLKAAGYNVNIQYFLNDQGLQIGKVLWGLQNQEKIGMTVDKNSTEKYDTQMAKVYTAAEKYLGTHTEEEPDVRAIIQKMEEGNNSTASFAYETTTKIVKGQLDTVQKFGVTYDYLVTEGVMTQSKEVERVINELIKTQKVTKETEGQNAECVVIKGLTDDSGKEIDEKVLLRKDGTAVYTAKDIVLHLWKFGKYDINFRFKPFYELNNHQAYISTLDTDGELKPQNNVKLHINVVDQRQSYPLEVVKQSLNALGYTEEANNLHHLAYETVVLSKAAAEELIKKKGIDIEVGDKKTVAMSGRKGIEISVDDLLDILTKQIAEASKEKKNEIPIEEAQKIAASSLRYFMIKFSLNTIIVFDFDEVQKTDGDSGIYLMYAYVRAVNILKKLANIKLDSKVSLNENVGIHPSVQNLLLRLSVSNDVIKDVIRTHEVNRLAEHTYLLAKDFMKLYQEVPISQEKDQDKQNLAIATVLLFIKTYGELLNILGIETVDRM